jgi:hypothetical protein
MAEKKIYFECVEDYIWGEPPSGFIENKHFVICPKCKHGMKAFRTENPITDGLLAKNKVQLSLLMNIGDD